MNGNDNPCNNQQDMHVGTVHPIRKLHNDIGKRSLKLPEYHLKREMNRGRLGGALWVVEVRKPRDTCGLQGCKTAGLGTLLSHMLRCNDNPCNKMIDTQLGTAHASGGKRPADVGAGSLKAPYPHLEDCVEAKGKA